MGIRAMALVTRMPGTRNTY